MIVLLSGTIVVVTQCPKAVVQTTHRTVSQNFCNTSEWSTDVNFLFPIHGAVMVLLL